MSENDSNNKAVGKDWTLLLVDDEPNVLNSLRRALRPLGTRIVTAGNGREGLEVLEREAVDLILSDMRMPEMNGAEFLAEAARRWPDRARILLTGFAEMQSTIDAINKGHIDRYLSKPWEDNDLRLTVQRSVEARRVKMDQMRLTVLIHQRSRELKQLNERLSTQLRKEGRVPLADDAREALLSTMRRVIRLRHPAGARHASRVARLARMLAEQLNLPEPRVEDVYVAGLLHDVGKISLGDGLLDKPFESLVESERDQLIAHPVLGQSLFEEVPGFQEVAGAIRAHHERFDGKGFPDALSGESIPLAARIVALANDFDALQMGTLFEGALTPAKARRFISDHRGKRYDPRVVEAFVEVTAQQAKSVEGGGEVRRLSHQLREGMVVSRDLVDGGGRVLVPVGHCLSQSNIDLIVRQEGELGETYVIHVARGE